MAEQSCGKRFDPFALLAGIATLLVSAFVLTDGAIWDALPDARWLIAGGAVIGGLMLLLGSTMRGKNQ
ncbi:hypothetical protein [Actinokineospora xionganensis]|uniref:Uncharacterized protein n=1 Tax=Actinokineospora xionganensis TaxID=2684470 RepID=A0ABR7L1D8_9PSEU|nr:hypothetical protein [Actinokineospora xionganensis]MBC6446269.1 hypothetical protein [Actinokineospora xionganensis]